MNNKYSVILTSLLVAFIVVILGIVAYFVYDAFYFAKIDSDAQAAIDEFDKTSSSVSVKPKPNVQNNVTNENTNTSTNEVVENTTTNENINYDEILNNIANQMTQDRPQTNTETPEDKYYKGFVMLGVIEIPKINIEYPIVPEATKRALEVAIGVASPINLTKLNEVGNTALFGHNYRNGKFFSNNKKLTMGDEIYITDAYGVTIVYEIYEMYETSAEDARHLENRDTQGKREISLQTCTDDGARRIIILAREK